jgi:hypothetical protein
MAAKMLTTTEAGKRLNVRPETIKHLCGSGRVPGAVRRPRAGAINAPWLVPEAWVRVEERRRASGVSRVGRPYNLAPRRVASEKNPKSDQTGHLGNGTSPSVDTSDIVTNQANR